jgi:tetratricopeptide (TPR) repeat protein
MQPKVPTYRPISGWKLVILSIEVTLLVILVNILYGPSSWDAPLVIALGLYYLYLFTVVRYLRRHHKNGVRLFKSGNFREAIPEFEASYRFFDTHRWVDKGSVLTMSSISPYTYRELALLNIGFCYSQIGEGAKAKQFYEQTLREYPNNGLKATLNMIAAIENKIV